jgi:GT2 family glycosyltransferase
VLDNGSNDDSVAQIRAVLPELYYPAELIENGYNLGFAEGNNVGIRKALSEGADYVLLLNNDTEIAPDFIEPLVKMAQSNPNIGITGSKIYYFDAPELIWSAGGIIGKSGATHQLGVNQPDSPEFNQLRKVDYVSGCAMLVKRAVIEKVGMLDARFFAYYEETDWCARTTKAGFTVWYVPQSKVWHKISLKARVFTPYYVYLMSRNRLLFLRNRGMSAPRVLLSLVLVDLRTIATTSIFKRHRAARPMQKWHIKGVLDYLRGRFGEPILK